MNDKLKEVAKPLVEYLRKNYHPHVIAIVEGDGTVAILEGIENITKFEEAEGGE
jgi:hypothetical protein